MTGANADPARHTRTSRLYYVGCRYLREKGEHGTNQHAKKRSPQVEGPSGRVCERIAKEERLGRATVQRAAKMARHIGEACASGLFSVAL